MPLPNQPPLDFGGMTPREYAQPRPGEAAPVQPPPTPPPRRPPDTRSFGERYGTAAATGAAGAATIAIPAGAIASATGTPVAGAIAAGTLMGGGALGGIAEQATRDLAPQWSEDYPWLAPAVGIAATGGIGGAARGARFAMQHGPAAIRTAATAAGTMGLSAAAYGAGLINLATHAVTFGTPAALAAGAATLYGLGRGLTSPRRFLETYVAPTMGAAAEAGRNQLLNPPPPPPAAEADIPLRPWSDTLPANRGTRLQADPGAAGQ